MFTENLESWNLRIKSDPKDVKKNSLLHKSSKKSCHPYQNFFRTLKITQKFASTQEVFIQEKWLNLHKNEFCVVFNLPKFLLCFLLPH